MTNTHRPSFESLIPEAAKDLRAPWGYFSQKDQDQILERAQSLFWAHPQALDQPHLVWREIVQNFHQNQSWGYFPRADQETVETGGPQTPAQEMKSYLWTFVQAVLVMKAVILYFGLKAAEEGSLSSQLALVGCVFFSFLSLVFFAWRKSKSETKSSPN